MMPEAMIQLLFTDSYCIFFTMLGKLEVKKGVAVSPFKMLGR